MAKLLKLLPWIPLPQSALEKARAELRGKGLGKTTRLSAAQRYIWIEFLSASNFCDDRQRGRLVSEKDGEALSQRKLAQRCVVSVSTINAVLRKFQALDWLEQDDAGAWVIKDHADWTVRETNAVREPNGGVRAANGVFQKPNASVRETNGIPEAGTARGNSGGDQKADQSLVELEDRLRRIVAQAAPPATPIEKAETTRKDRLISKGATGTVSSQQRPDDALLSAVAGAFLRAVGRPLDQHDRAALVEIADAGHTQEEIIRAVQHHGQRGPVRLSGLRYIKPMILKGDFRDASPARSPRTPSLPTGSVTVGADAALIAQRNAKRRALLKTQDQ